MGEPPPRPMRFTPLEEYLDHHVTRMVGGRELPNLSDDELGAFTAEIQARRLKASRWPEQRLWAWRWRIVLTLIVVGFVVSAGTIAWGLRGPADETWPSLLVGIGGGILGSSFVALVVFMVETKLGDIRDRETFVARQEEREQLLQNMSLDVDIALSQYLYDDGGLIDQVVQAVVETIDDANGR